jgi:TonB family protein
VELWRPEVMEGRRPDVLSTRTFVVALVLHLVVFAVFWIVAAANGLFAKKETIIPIDLTVIVNENLDGVENEPPPVLNPPPPEPPKPKTRKPDPPKPKKVEPPKPLEQIETNIVKKVTKDTKDKKDQKDKEKKDKDKEKKPEEKKPDKKPEEKKPEQPKKTAKELREERLKRIRDKAKVNNKPVKIEVRGAKASGNGKTGRQTMSEAEIRKLLDQGYRPGTQNQLATNEKQRCISLIQMAIEEKWDALLPKVGRNGTVLLSVQFNSAGGLINVKLAKSCGDPLSDQAALTVARAVTSISGLSADFIAEFRKTPLTIRYNVQGR